MREDLLQVLAASRRAGALTRQLLTFSRRQVLQPRILQLNEIVADVEKMLRRVIGENIELLMHLSPRSGPCAPTRVSLNRSYSNLTINARDAMPDGGKLIIETSNVELDESYAAAHAGVISGSYAMLAVTDTGIGMDAATQKRIFEPFFTTKEVGKGTGLGLSTVYGIVRPRRRSHRGVQRTQPWHVFQDLLFESRWLCHIFSTPPPKRGAPTRGATILLVEDDDAVRQIAARVLRDHGYTVMETRRPSEARSACASLGSGIDLLLTDIVMPETSGMRLAEELSRLYPQMRVLYMSGYPGGAVTLGASLEVGAAYLEKPFTPASLTEKYVKHSRSVWRDKYAAR